MSLLACLLSLAALITVIPCAAAAPASQEPAATCDPCCHPAQSAGAPLACCLLQSQSPQRTLPEASPAQPQLPVQRISLPLAASTTQATAIRTAATPSPPPTLHPILRI